MAYFSTCPVCGATLDPGESCGCEESEAKGASEKAKNKEIPPER